jgi:3-hydroxyacyl-CoA dehydrogenase
VLDAARRFSEIVLGKGIVLAKDVPGFVANRWVSTAWWPR